MKAYDIIVVGAGTAGLSAAIYGVRAGLLVLCIKSHVHGGQIINTPDIVNYPGIETISGAEFANRLLGHATGLGAEVVYETIADADLSSCPKKIKTDRGEYTAKAVILANGAHHRELGCVGEKEFQGRGVSYCATCDGGFYKGKVTCVAGGGNTALEDALYLCGICPTVHLIHRRDAFRASAPTVQKVKSTKNIVLHLGWQIVGISGENTVSGVTLQNTEDQTKKTLAVSGVFVAIGLQPDNAQFARWVELDDAGYVVAKEDCKTKTAGVFVAGDTRTKAVRQLITAAADGAVAATQAAQYLQMANG